METEFIALCTSTCAHPVTPLTGDRLAAILGCIARSSTGAPVQQELVNAFARVPYSLGYCMPCAQLVGCLHDSLYRHVREHEVAGCDNCLQRVYLAFVDELVAVLHERHGALAVALLHSLQFALLDRAFMRRIMAERA